MFKILFGNKKNKFETLSNAAKHNNIKKQDQQNSLYDLYLTEPEKIIKSTHHKQTKLKRKKKHNFTRKIKKLKKLYDSSTDGIKWSSKLYMLEIVSELISKRYNACIQKLKIYIGMDNLNVKNINDTIKNIKTCLNKNKEKNIVLIYLSFSNESFGHANLLVYRPNAKIIEWFEPHGSYFNNDNYKYIDVRTKLSEYISIFVYKLDKHIILVESSIVCPYLYGLQHYEQSSKIPKINGDANGYCALWVFLIVDLVLKFPYLTTNQITELLLENNNPDELRQLIKGFNNYLSGQIKKYKHVDMNEIINANDIIEKNETNTIATNPLKNNQSLNDILLKANKNAKIKNNNTIFNIKEKKQSIFSHVSPASVYSKKTSDYDSMKQSHHSSNPSSSTY